MALTLSIRFCSNWELMLSKKMKLSTKSTAAPPKISHKRLKKSCNFGSSWRAGRENTGFCKKLVTLIARTINQTLRASHGA
ncbi:hypothetical protein [Prosthecobacter vanneervenii]|uniref:Uncharacterized protein n=1 Tax=Prosthecobacter vanneervenii TaxID=48466 RepID=A0A7W8DMS5_9BACT|nr:hypothetical protein [Prosthecobacter vanneervenii]MBB5035151.1 hypothetical protein [Prosthecobacter vanneervenii]